MEHAIHSEVRLLMFGQKINNEPKQVTKLGAYIIVAWRYWGSRTIDRWAAEALYQRDRVLESWLNGLLDRMYSSCNAVERMRWRASDRQWRYEVGA